MWRGGAGDRLWPVWIKRVLTRRTITSGKPCTTSCNTSFELNLHGVAAGHSAPARPSPTLRTSSWSPAGRPGSTRSSTPQGHPPPFSPFNLNNFSILELKLLFWFYFYIFTLLHLNMPLKIQIWTFKYIFVF